MTLVVGPTPKLVTQPPGCTATCSAWTGERSAGVRKLFRLIQLEQVAERIVQEGLVAGARDKRDPLHLDALLLQVADSSTDIVDSDRKVVCTEWLGVGFHQVHLLAAGVEPVPGAEIGARQLRHAEHVAVEGETLLRVGDADGDMVHTGWLHHSILPRTQPCMTFRIARHVKVINGYQLAGPGFGNSSRRQSRF
jgi:hypothetical protein